MKAGSTARLVSLVLLYVAIGTTIARAAQKHGGGQFDQTAPPIRLINQTIFQAFAELYQSTGIVISVERILGRNGPLVDERFTATIRGGKPFQVLNDICALDRRYAWSRDGNVVNVYPWKTVGDPKYLFNQRIPSFELHDVSKAATAAIEADEQLPGKRSQLIILGTGGDGFAEPWSVKLGTVTLRIALNRIAQHLCSSCGWQLLPGKGSEPVLVFYRRLQPEEDPNI